MEKRKRKSTVWRRLQPGKASNYISHLENIQPGDRFVLCCRVSGYMQNHKGNLADSEANLRDVVRRHGSMIFGAFHRVGSGTDPFWLAPAAAFAKKYDAKLLAESTDRYIRHLAYHSVHWPDAQARESELLDLRLWTEGVPLVTLLHPDASPDEVRSYQSKRGQKFKKSRGGRPKKSRPRGKERMKAYLPLVKRMNEEGLSFREIRKALNAIEDEFPVLCHMTIANWINAEKGNSGRELGV